MTTIASPSSYILLLLLLLLQLLPLLAHSESVSEYRPLLLALQRSTTLQLQPCSPHPVTVLIPEALLTVTWQPELQTVQISYGAGSDVVHECRFQKSAVDVGIEQQKLRLQLQMPIVQLQLLLPDDAAAAAAAAANCSFVLSHAAAAAATFALVSPFGGCVQNQFSSRHCWWNCSEKVPSSEIIGEQQQQQQLIRTRRATTCVENSTCLNTGYCNPRCTTASCNPLCICLLPFLAPRCRVSVNYCATAQPESNITHPICHNGANCSMSLVQPYFSCSCVPGFTDFRCTTNINECESNPCINGNCTDLVNAYSCSCYPGWTGVNCSVNIDECAGAPCSNGGVCIDGINSFTCNCSNTGFQGLNCTENINDCSPNPCLNGGNCSDGIKNFSCSCHAGYAGKDCSTDIAECKAGGTGPCLNGGQCLERSNMSLYNSALLPAPFNGTFNVADAAGYVCQCLSGSSGSNCEINPNDCFMTVSNTSRNVSKCQQSVECIDGLNDYTCRCQPGYTGKNCSVDIDECQTLRPCLNGAACRDLVANFACDCVGDFGGRNCSVALTGCRSSPCSNRAVCRPILVSELPEVVHDFSCECPAGLTGKECNVTTVVSLTTASADGLGVEFNSNGSGLLQLSFRTTLSSSDVAEVVGEWGRVRLQLDAQQLLLSVANASNSSAVIGQLAQPITDQLQAAAWTKLSLNLQNGTAELNDTFWGVAELLASRAFRHGRQRVTVGAGGSWRGCFRDVQFDGVALLTPTTVSSAATSNASAVWGSCPRTNPCGGDPCSSAGSVACVDNWSEFRCRCRAGFAGATCSEKLPDFTFGRDSDGVGGLVFSSLPPAPAAAASRRSLQFQLVTLSPSSFVFLLEASSLSPKLVGVVSSSGAFSLRLISANGSEQLAATQSPASVADGQRRLLATEINDTHLTLRVDNSSFSSSSSSVVIADAFAASGGRLIVGGFSGAETPAAGGGWRVRARRALPSLPAGAFLPAGTTALKGIVGAMTLDGLPLVGAGNGTGGLLPGAISASDATGVADGALTDSVCELRSPCGNGAVCSNVFYNSYSCNCTDGWRGANCTQIDYCAAVYDVCPAGSQCVVIDGGGGFECQSAVTFGFNATRVNSLNFGFNGSSFNVTQLTGRVRSRQLDALLLSTTTTASSPSAQLSLAAGRLRASVGGASVVVEGLNASDGQWHSFVLDCIAGKPLNLTVENVSASSSSSPSSSLHIDTAATVSAASPTFRGCLSDVRFNERLLPLATPRSLLGGSGFHESSSSSSSSPRPLIGCRGDPLCESQRCLNGGTCSDAWNFRVCSCRAGYSGVSCGVADCSVVSCFATAAASTPLIIGLSCAALLVIVVVVIAALVTVGRKRRAESGLYKPSKLETQRGPEVDASVLRPPPEERLI